MRRTRLTVRPLSSRGSRILFANSTKWGAARCASRSSPDSLVSSTPWCALDTAEAASTWLGSLTAEQRAGAQGTPPAYDDPLDAERRRWFYTATDHGGLTVRQQRPAQQRAAMKLVATGLSMAGYVTVATTLGLENVLDRVEGFVTRFDRERGRDPGRTTCASSANRAATAPGDGGSAATVSPSTTSSSTASSSARSLPTSDFVTANRTTVSEGDQVIPAGRHLARRAARGRHRAGQAAGAQRRDRRGGRVHPR